LSTISGTEPGAGNVIAAISHTPGAPAGIRVLAPPFSSTPGVVIQVEPSVSPSGDRRWF